MPQAEIGWGWYAERAEGYPLVDLIVYAFVLNFCAFFIVLYFMNTPKIAFDEKIQRCCYVNLQLFTIPLRARIIKKETSVT